MTVAMGYSRCGCEYRKAGTSHTRDGSRAVHLHLMQVSQSCHGISLAVGPVKQRHTCGCGLAALEMVLRYYGMTDTQIDFLADGRIRRLADCSKRGLSEGTLGTLALKRGFHVRVLGQKLRLTSTYLKLGGEVDRIRTTKCSILQCLRRGISPIVLIPSVMEAFEFEVEEVGHYAVVTGVDARCRLRIADPQYAHPPGQQYWNKWSSSLIEITPRQ
jgi:hypothetical protein